MRPFVSLAGLLFIAATGCAHHHNEAAPAASPQMQQRGGGMGGQMAGMCPMQVPGTTVTATDIEGGVALTFATSTGDVDELRQRVHRIAEMHNQRQGQGGRMMPAATATTEDIPEGAQVIIRPQDPSQLDSVREHVHAHAEQMAKGECPGMHSHSHSHSDHGAGSSDMEQED